MSGLRARLTRDVPVSRGPGLARWRYLGAAAVGAGVVLALSLAGSLADFFVLNFPLLVPIGVVAALGLLVGTGWLWAMGRRSMRGHFLLWASFFGGFIGAGALAGLIWGEW